LNLQVQSPISFVSASSISQYFMGFIKIAQILVDTTNKCSQGVFLGMLTATLKTPGYLVLP